MILAYDNGDVLRNMKLIPRLAGIAFVPLFIALGIAQPARPTRGLTVDDMLSLEQITPISLGRTTFAPIAVSPDGLQAAIVVQRKRNPGDQYAWASLASAERTDIWLVSTNVRGAMPP